MYTSNSAAQLSISGFQINDFFLPPSNDLHHKFSYGYVIHRDQQGLYKLDLEAMQYVKNIDLQKYNCVPNSVAFIPMGKYTQTETHTQKHTHINTNIHSHTHTHTHTHTEKYTHTQKHIHIHT